MAARGNPAVAPAETALKVWHEFLIVLRREGLEFSTAQARDALRALALVGHEQVWRAREALACVLCSSQADRERLERVFREHFRPGVRGISLWQRLEALGLSSTERSAVADFLRGGEQDGDALSAWLEGGVARDDWLARSLAMRSLRRETESAKVGYWVHQVLEQARVPRAEERLGALELHLREALGHERAAQIAALVRQELQREAQRVRRLLRDRAIDSIDELQATRLAIGALDHEQQALAERAVKRLAERLVMRQRLRLQRARRGTIDLRATLQRSKRTFGLPMQLVRRSKRLRPGRLVVVCDVSESVREAARFLLLFVYCAQKHWERIAKGQALSVRTFVFVSDLGETTAVFSREGPERALSLAYGGAVVSTAHNSNYGRAFAQLERIAERELDRRTVLIVLGDGRTNFLDPGLEVLDRLRKKVRRLIWLCPEPEAAWGRGDSRMRDYAARAHAVLPATSLEDLQQALWQVSV